jgi:hypothetical protein
MTGNILEQAKQGNPNAIAALMSRSMKSQGIDVKASLDDRCLEVILEAAKVPTPATTVSFIRKGMTNLGVNSIDTVRVSAYQTGDSTPAWQEDIVLQEAAFSGSQTPMSSSQFGSDETDPLLEDEDLLPEDLLEDGLSSPGYGSLSEQNFYNDDYGNELPDEVTEFTPDDEYSASDYGRDQDESMDDNEDMEMTEEESSGKKRSSVLPLLLLLLAALGLGGFYLYSQKPELLAGIPFLKDYLPPSSSPETSIATTSETAEAGTSPEAAAEAGTSPEAAAEAGKSPEVAAEAGKSPEVAAEVGTSPEAETQPTEAKPAPTQAPSAETPKTDSSAPAVSANDPFPEAVRKAISAAQLTQTASTPEEWDQVAADWQSAIDLMQSVPDSNPKYSVAQQRVPVYQKNLQYAQNRAGQ